MTKHDDPGVTSIQQFLAEGGHAGAILRTMDWSASVLGAPSAWPAPVKTLVGVMLGSSQPMFIAWGPGRTLLYNDAYAEILGSRHPAAMGEDFLDVWSEIRADLTPIVEQAYAGQPVHMDDIQLFMLRKGSLAETHFSFFYAPVRDDDGAVGGLYCACNEITAKVLADRARDAAEQALRESETRHRALLQQMPGFVAVLTGPDHVYEYTNQAFADITANRDVIGKSVREAFPEFVDQGFYELLDDAYRTGDPFVARDLPMHLEGQRQRYIDLLYEPIRQDGAVAGIFVGGYDVTERVQAERRQRLLVALTDEFRNAKGPGDLSFAAGRIAGEALGASRVGFGTVDSEADTLHVERDWAAPGVETLEGVTPLRDYGSFIDSLKDGQFVVIGDVRSDPRTAAAASALEGRDARSFVNVPVLEHDRLVAVLYVNSDRPRTWTEDELSFIREVAERTRTSVERARSEQALLESMERFRAVLAIETVGAIYFDMEGKLTDANDAFLRMSGYTRADLEAGELSWHALTPPEHLDASELAFAELRAHGVTTPYEKEYIRKDGSRWWGLFAATLLPDQTGFEFVLDITDRKKTEATLQRLNETLEDEVTARTAERNRVWENSRDLLGVATFDGRLASVNPAWTRALGRSEKELLSRPFTDIIHPDDLATTRDVVASLQAGEGVHQFSVRLLTSDGTPLSFAWSAVPDADRPGLFYTVGRDVTDENERAAALRLHENIVQSDRSPICAFDKDFRLIAFNQAHNDEFRRVNGFDTKLGDVFPDLFIPEQQAVMRGLMSRALSGERFTVVEAFGRPELGTPNWEIGYTPLRDDAGEIIGAFHHARDITDRLSAEAERDDAQEALRQSQKMEAMGSLTGGVAHDFNNLLTPIIGSLDMLQRKGVGGSREQRLIDGALVSAERAKTLVQRLLAFARRQPLQPKPSDIGVLVAGMADLIASTTGPQIKVVVDVGTDLPPAVADANQLEMAILNLAVNARDAMVGGGTLRISARAEVVAASHPTRLDPGRYVCISVADTGQGMEPNVLARAIEPFFSTKGVGRGTGLGLSMVHGLASQLGGALRIDSKVGFGTNAQIWLPASTSAVEDASAEPVGSDHRVAVGTALLVDDEELVRTSTADMLADLGYAVVEASSAEEALRVVKDGLRFDVLVTDHLMPGMSGTELAREVLRRQADAHVLVVSGYAEVDGVAPDLPRLVKPFRQADLIAKLKELSEITSR